MFELYLLRIMVFLIRGWSAILKRKTLKSEEKGKRRIRGKSCPTIYIFGIKLYFAQKHNLKKSCLYHQFFFIVFMRCRVLKRSNDTPNLNIHKYANYNRIEMYINKLSATTQIFIAMDYVIMMSEKCLYFR